MNDQIKELEEALMGSDAKAPALELPEEPAFAEWLAPRAHELYSRQLHVSTSNFSYEANVRGAETKNQDGSVDVEYRRAIHHVRFMGIRYESIGQMFDNVKASALGRLSDAFNKLVRLGVLTDGVMAPCHSVPLALREGDPADMKREIALVYVGSPVEADTLNTLLGAPAFVQEGELPNAW